MQISSFCDAQFLVVNAKFMLFALTLPRHLVQADRRRGLQVVIAVQQIPRIAKINGHFSIENHRFAGGVPHHFRISNSNKSEFILQFAVLLV